MQSQDFSSTSVLVNGKEAGSYFTKETDCILYVGSFAPGEQVTVSVLPSTAVHVDYIEIAELNTELLQDTLLSLQANGIQLTSLKGPFMSLKARKSLHPFLTIRVGPFG